MAVSVSKSLHCGERHSATGRNQVLRAVLHPSCGKEQEISRMRKALVEKIQARVPGADFSFVLRANNDFVPWPLSQKS